MAFFFNIVHKAVVSGGVFSLKEPRVTGGGLMGVGGGAAKVGRTGEVGRGRFTERVGGVIGGGVKIREAVLFYYFSNIKSFYLFIFGPP